MSCIHWIQTTLLPYGSKDAYRTDAKRNRQEAHAHDLQNQLTISDMECHVHCKYKLGLCTFVSGDKKKGISAQGIAARIIISCLAANSGKMECMLLAGGFCDLTKRNSVCQCIIFKKKIIM